MRIHSWWVLVFVWMYISLLNRCSCSSNLCMAYYWLVQIGALQQWGGSNAMGYYASSIFEEAGNITSFHILLEITNKIKWNDNMSLFICNRFFKNLRDGINGYNSGIWLSNICEILLIFNTQTCQSFLQILAAGASTPLIDKSGRLPLLMVKLRNNSS